MGALSALTNSKFSTNIGSYIDIYVTDFSIKGALLPLMIIISPLLSIFYYKKPDTVIKICLLIGAITYLAYFALFNYYSPIKTIVLLAGLSVSFTNIFF